MWYYKDTSRVTPAKLLRAASVNKIYQIVYKNSFFWSPKIKHFVSHDFYEYVDDKTKHEFNIFRRILA